MASCHMLNTQLLLNLRVIWAFTALQICNCPVYERVVPSVPALPAVLARLRVVGAV